MQKPELDSKKSNSDEILLRYGRSDSPTDMKSERRGWLSTRHDMALDGTADLGRGKPATTIWLPMETLFTSPTSATS